MEQLIKALCGTIFTTLDGTEIVGVQTDGCPIVVSKQDGRIWLEITVFDKDMDDGRELVYEIVRVN